MGINKTLTTCTAGKLRLGYPKSITPEEIPFLLMLRLLPLPIFICIYLFSWWRCKKNIIASDKQLKSCIDWAYIKNLPLPPKPSFVEFYIVYVSSFFKFPFGIIIQQLPFAKKVRYYEREMKLIFDKWNLEKIKKIIN